MNELIKIDQTYMPDGNEVNTVNARDLHAFLGIQRDFSNWIKAQINRARLVENRDYIIFAQKGVYKKPLTDYFLTLDAAKHVAMISGTEEGFKIREYFIEVEKRSHVPQVQLTREQQLAQAVLISQEVIAEKDQKIAQLSGEVKHLERTKAQIGDKRVASALGTASGAVRRAKKEAKEKEKYKSKADLADRKEQLRGFYKSFVNKYSRGNS